MIIFKPSYSSMYKTSIPGEKKLSRNYCDHLEVQVTTSEGQLCHQWQAIPVEVSIYVELCLGDIWMFYINPAMLGLFGSLQTLIQEIRQFEVS
jgi:hypothetical protein